MSLWSKSLKAGGCFEVWLPDWKVIDKLCLRVLSQISIIPIPPFQPNMVISGSEQDNDGHNPKPWTCWLDLDTVELRSLASNFAQRPLAALQQKPHLWSNEYFPHDSHSENYFTKTNGRTRSVLTLSIVSVRSTKLLFTNFPLAKKSYLKIWKLQLLLAYESCKQFTYWIEATWLNRGYFQSYVPNKQTIG